MPKKLPSSSLKRNKRGYHRYVHQTRGYPAGGFVSGIGFTGGAPVRYQLIGEYLSCTATLELRWMDTLEVGTAQCPFSLVHAYAERHFMKDKGLLADHLRVLSALALCEVMTGNRWLTRSQIISLASLSARRAPDILLWMHQTGQIIVHTQLTSKELVSMGGRSKGRGNRSDKLYFLSANGQNTLNELHAYILTYAEIIQQRAKTMGLPLKSNKTIKMAAVDPDFSPLVGK